MYNLYSELGERDQINAYERPARPIWSYSPLIDLKLITCVRNNSDPDKEWLRICLYTNEGRRARSDTIRRFGYTYQYLQIHRQTDINISTIKKPGIHLAHRYWELHPFISDLYNIYRCLNNLLDAYFSLTFPIMREICIPFTVQFFQLFV